MLGLSQNLKGESMSDYLQNEEKGNEGSNQNESSNNQNSGNNNNNQQGNYNNTYDNRQNNSNYNDYQNYNASNNRNNVGQHTSKMGLGVLFALFLGVIGLLIGICMYSEGSYERQTFVKGWVRTFLTVIGICLFIVLFVVIFAW